MAPNVICVSHGQNDAKFAYSGGSKMSIWGVKNSKFCFATNAPQSHLAVSHDQNLHIRGGVRNAYFGCQNICTKKRLLEMPPKVICMSPMTKICIFGGESKMFIFGVKISKFCFATNPPKSHLGVSNDQNLHILEPNYLPHAATNTAACKCISLFCNTFLEGSSSYATFWSSSIWTVNFFILSKMTDRWPYLLPILTIFY